MFQALASVGKSLLGGLGSQLLSNVGGSLLSNLGRSFSQGEQLNLSSLRGQVLGDIKRVSQDYLGSFGRELSQNLQQQMRSSLSSILPQVTSFGSIAPAARQIATDAWNSVMATTNRSQNFTAGPNMGLPSIGVQQSTMGLVAPTLRDFAPFGTGELVRERLVSEGRGDLLSGGGYQENTTMRRLIDTRISDPVSGNPYNQSTLPNPQINSQYVPSGFVGSGITGRSSVQSGQQLALGL